MNAHADPDRELVEEAQGELPYGTRAYDGLVRRYSSHVYRRCYRILGSAPDAEEVSQEVFLSVFKSLPRYRFEKPFSHWLNVVTLNACRMHLRQRTQEARRRSAFQQENAAELPERPKERTDPVLRALVLELLDDIDVGQRIPLLMHYVEGHTYAEVAQELEISESAAKMRVSRGAKRLRELYEARLARTGTTSENGDG